MKKIFYLSVCFYMLIHFSLCKSDNKGNIDETTSAVSKSDPNADPLLIPIPKGFYRPSGLKPLNIIEMFNRGMGNPEFVKNLKLKDKNGNDVSNSILENPEKPMFVQMYANDSSRVLEAVVYEMTDEIKNQIMRARMSVKKSN